MPRQHTLNAGTAVSEKRTVNFVAGGNMTITATEAGNQVNIQFDAAAGASSYFTDDLVVVDASYTANKPTLTTVTAHASIHTEGNWTEIITTTSAPATMLRVIVDAGRNDGAASSLLVDIGTGAALSETTLVANLNAGYSPAYSGTANTYSREYWLPIAVAAGTRISARCQALITADTIGVAVITYTGTNTVATAIDTIGASALTSKGVDVIAGLSGAEGAWTQITAATSAAYTGLLVGIGGAADAGVVSANGLLDIGTGASLSEVAIVSNKEFASQTNETISVSPRFGIPHKVTIANGARVTARISIDTAGAQSYDVILYGLR